MFKPSNISIMHRDSVQKKRDFDTLEGITEGINMNLSVSDLNEKRQFNSPKPVQLVKKTTVFEDLESSHKIMVNRMDLTPADAKESWNIVSNFVEKMNIELKVISY